MNNEKQQISCIVCVGSTGERELVESIKGKNKLEGGVDRPHKALYNQMCSVLNCKVLTHS